MNNTCYQFYDFLLRPHLIYMMVINALFSLNYAEDK